MTDWTTCRVVRDRDGDLWFRGCDSDDLWTANTNYPDVFLTTDEVLTVFGPTGAFPFVRAGVPGSAVAVTLPMAEARGFSGGAR